MMKKNSPKLKMLATVTIFIGVIVAFVIAGDGSSARAGKNRSVASIVEINDKIGYIKAKDCPDAAYDNMGDSDPRYNMCRAYTTDGVFVYYDGLRSVSIPFMPTSIPTISNGHFSSSSMSMYVPEEHGPIPLEGADVNTFEIISADYLDSSLDPEQNQTFVYARDKNSLYREGKKVVGANPDTLVILGQGYIKDENAVFIRGEKIEGSDPKTFEFLKYGYAHDKNFVYLIAHGEKIENSNGKTFEVINEDYAKDSNFVYYKQKKLDGADASTFEVVTPPGLADASYVPPSGYAKDKNFLYYQGARVAGADPATFIVVSGGYLSIQAYDKNFVYGYAAKKLSWIDAGTFESVSGGYYKDKNAVYYGEGKVIDGADSATFEYLGGVYSKDKNFVWKSQYLDEGGAIGGASRIKDADTETFQYLKYEYARDKNFVYYYGDVLSGAAPRSFTALTQEYSKDSSSVFMFNNTIASADAESFSVMDTVYSKDKNFVYHLGVKLPGVDPTSLVVYSCGYIKDKSKVFRVHNDSVIDTVDVSDPSSFTMFKNGCYAKDKNFVYYLNYESVRMEGANPKTFEVIDGWYTKDSSTVYYMGTRIPGADPKTFTVLKGEYVKDKNAVYYRGVRIEGVDIGSFEVNSYGTEAKDKNTVYRSGKPFDAEAAMRQGDLSPGVIPPSGILDAVMVTPYPIGL